jgi:hypothetical protein
VEVKKSHVKSCAHHPYFVPACHYCLVDTVVGLCNHLDDQAADTDEEVAPSRVSISEVFEGTHIVHVDENSIMNVVALPQTEEDFKNQIIRYTIETRKKES